ncbi:GNAT family N-acetyltransferase [Dyella humi]|uniref:GNAT family N-acetyltransferase n=1 Tax=Dyella humi TaxID=1770547 RepID=A0ABW8IFH1_9GAMM
MTYAYPDRGFQVEPGRPGDIFFFVTEIVSGAWRGRFGGQFCSLPMTEKEFGIRCAKAILGQLLPFWRTAVTRQFVVVRHRREIIGAALSYADTHQTGPSLICIDVVVVNEQWRRQGVGQALVTYFQKRTPPGGRLECYCMSESRVMARLVKRLGFVRTHKAAKFTIKGQIALPPERWEWQAKCASRTLDPVRRNADIAKCL